MRSSGKSAKHLLLCNNPSLKTLESRKKLTFFYAHVNSWNETQRNGYIRSMLIDPNNNHSYIVSQLEKAQGSSFNLPKIPKNNLIENFPNIKDKFPSQIKNGTVICDKDEGVNLISEQIVGVIANSNYKNLELVIKNKNDPKAPISNGQPNADFLVSEKNSKITLTKKPSNLRKFDSIVNVL